MGIGFYRYKIQLVVFAGIADGYGGRSEGTQSTILDVFANVRQIDMDRNDRASQTNWDKLYDFDLRYHNSILIGKATFIIYENSYFTIQSIEKVNERTHYWKIRAAKSDITAGGGSGSPSFNPLTLKTFNYQTSLNENPLYLKDSSGSIMIGANILIFVRSGEVIQVILTGTPTTSQVRYNAVTGELTFTDTFGPDEFLQAIFI